jgi:hypothetical protein
MALMVSKKKNLNPHFDNHSELGGGNNKEFSRPTTKPNKSF